MVLVGQMEAKASLGLGTEAIACSCDYLQLWWAPENSLWRTARLPELWSMSCSTGGEQGLCVPGSELPLILEQIRRSSVRSLENLALEMLLLHGTVNASTTNKAIMLLEGDIQCSSIQREFLERQDNDSGIEAGLSIVQ